MTKILHKGTLELDLKAICKMQWLTNVLQNHTINKTTVSDYEKKKFLAYSVDYKNIAQFQESYNLMMLFYKLYLLRNKKDTV